MIELDVDGRYKKCILFDDKSYILLEYNNNKILKGNTLTGRSNEKFVLEFIHNSVDYILQETPNKIVEEYNKWRKQIKTKTIGVDYIKKRQNISMSLEEYNNKVAAGQNKIAQYEAAILAERNYIKGDVIETWVEEPAPVMKTYKTKDPEISIPDLPAYETIRHASNFNGNIYTDHYLDRLEKTAKKLLVVLGWSIFESMFPNIKLKKPEKRKMLGKLGLKSFVEEFGDFGFLESDYEKLSKQEQTLFRKYVKEEKLAKKYEEYYG